MMIFMEKRSISRYARIGIRMVYLMPMVDHQNLFSMMIVIRGMARPSKLVVEKMGKKARMYEKGKEQGDPNDPWFRIELELRNKDRIIPWDILLKSGQYLAGAYQAFNYLCEEQIKLKTITKQKDMTYEQTVDWVRTAAGKALNVIIQENDGDLSAVFELVVREGIPKRLEPYYK